MAVLALHTFNVDCGEVIPGHRLVATGLRDDGLSNDTMNADYMRHYPAKTVHRVASLTYELVPGLPQPADDSNLDIDANVVPEPPPDPEEWGSTLTMGGEREARTGGPATRGASDPSSSPKARRQSRRT